MARKPVKKSTSVLQMSNFSDFDRTFDNFRRDMEKSFYSFPRIDFPSFPKLQETTCDIMDEGKQLRVKMDVPGVTKKDVTINVTDNSLEISAEHKEESKKTILEKNEVMCRITEFYRYLKKLSQQKSNQN